MQRMADTLIDALPPAQRLALAYAPKGGRTLTLGLLALDTRLASCIRNRGEVLTAQLRLAWWRDMLARPATDWPDGEPLLEVLQGWAEARMPLVALVDGWEELLGEGPLPTEALSRFAAARAAGFAALAELLGNAAAVEGAAQAGMRWALADLAAGLSDPLEKARALDLAMSADQKAGILPRNLRSLAVLNGLAERAIRRGGAPLLDGAGALLLAMRIGLTGR